MQLNSKTAFNAKRAKVSQSSPRRNPYRISLPKKMAEPEAPPFFNRNYAVEFKNSL